MSSSSSSAAASHARSNGARNGNVAAAQARNGVRATTTRMSNLATADAAATTTAADAAAAAASSSSPTRICFNVCRKEQYHANKGYKQLTRKLRQWATVDVNKEDVTLDRLAPYDLVVFAAPQTRLSASDLAAVREYVEKGGSVLMLFGDGHGGHYSYLNDTLAEWVDTTLNEDCVVRTVLHKYLHPKEVCVTNGVTNRAINQAAGKTMVYGGAAGADAHGSNAAAIAADGAGGGGGGGRDGGPLTMTTATRHHGMLDRPSLAATAEDATSGASSSSLGGAGGGKGGGAGVVFVYPHGLTFNVNRPSTVLLSSGFMAYPLNRPIAVAYECPDAVEHRGRRKHGKLLLVGSALMFDDAWLGKEENDLLAGILFDYLDHRVRLDQIDADEPDITDYHHLPDTAALSEQLRVAVEQQEELPRDFTRLFELQTFALDTNKIPAVMDTYEKLNVKLEPLTLIPPEFQTPLPPVKPAVFGPIHHDPAPPALDLFDVDEEFAPERVRLSQLTNKCKPEDVAFYITQAAEIMGVTKKLRSPRNREPRALLHYIAQQIVHYKKSSSGGGVGAVPAAAAVADAGAEKAAGGTSDQLQPLPSSSSQPSHGFARSALGGYGDTRGNGSFSGNLVNAAGSATTASSSSGSSSGSSRGSAGHHHHHGGADAKSRAGNAGTAAAAAAARGGDGTAAAAAAASGMTRIMRVRANAASDAHTDATPFDDNPRWTLLLEADYATSTMRGSLTLHDSSPRFAAQEVRVEGDLKAPGTHEYAMEWGVVLTATDGQQAFYVFLANVQGNQLRGVCEKSGGVTSNTRNFLYLIEDL